MNKAAIFLFVILIACGIMLGCSPRHTISVGEADSGKSIEIKAGDILKISLPGNPTTGYNWVVSAVDTQVLTQVGDPAFKASSSAMGAGGIITLTFHAPMAGQTSLQLQYKRAWEKGVNPLYTYNLRVVVK